MTVGGPQGRRPNTGYARLLSDTIRTRSPAPRRSTCLRGSRPARRSTSRRSRRRATTSMHPSRSGSTRVPAGLGAVLVDALQRRSHRPGAGRVLRLRHRCAAAAAIGDLRPAPHVDRECVGTNRRCDGHHPRAEHHRAGDVRRAAYGAFTNANAPYFARSSPTPRAARSRSGMTFAVSANADGRRADRQRHRPGRAARVHRPDIDAHGIKIPLSALHGSSRSRRRRCKARALRARAARPPSHGTELNGLDGTIDSRVRGSRCA